MSLRSRIRRVRRKWRRWHRAHHRAVTFGLIGFAALVMVAAVVVVMVRGGSDVTAASEAPPLKVAPTGHPEPTSLDQARAALAAGDSVLVVGDSTGNAIDEWVAIWARSMTDSRTVQLRQWDANAERWAPEFTELGGTGPRLTVWNMSEPGAMADYPAHAHRLDSVAAAPDLVVYSFGHNDTFADIGPRMDSTAHAIARRWGDVPSVAILQNPTDGTLAARDRDVTNYLRTVWAPDNHVATIDVERAFRADGRPLSSLLRDVTHPNAEGSALWAQTVGSALSAATVGAEE